MKFSKYNRPYNEYDKWQNICSEGTWRIVSPSDFDNILPKTLLTKSNSILLIAAASPNSSVFVANLNRVDKNAIDQQPYILVFNHAASTASGGFVDHGNWPERTSTPDQSFFDAIAASGIQAYYPLKELPTASSGKLDELHVDSQRAAFWTALSALKNELGKAFQWLTIGIVVCVGCTALFVIVTDGRYLGKRLMFWIYDRFGAAMYGRRDEAARWQQLAGLLDLQGDERILDVGTAVADLPLTFAAQPNFQGHVTGLDWSPKMMAPARQEAQRRGLSRRVSLAVVDARRPLPFASRTFDITTCLETLETLPHPDRILREIIRILRPDGILVLSLYKGALSLTAALSLDWYQKQLQSYGFNLQLIQFRPNYDIVIGKIGD